jgi:hypothetical protein
MAHQQLFPGDFVKENKYVQSSMGESSPEASRNMNSWKHNVLLKNGVFWDVMLCGSSKNRRFGGTKRLLHQGDKNR